MYQVEHPRGGDETRHWGPPFLTATTAHRRRNAAYFLAANRGKRSIAIDLATPTASASCALAARSDILVENFKVGTLARYGLGYAST